MRIIIVGAGGHAKSCVSVAESAGDIVLGFLATRDEIGLKVNGYEVLGTDVDALDWADKCDGFIVGVGQLELCEPRRSIFNELVGKGCKLVSLKASDAFMDRTATWGPGSIAMHRAVINASARIGKNCILNTGSILEHDSLIGDHVHVSTGAIVNGGCSVLDGVFIGSGSIIRQGIKIEADVVVGAGSVVVSDLLEKGVYVGNPTRKIR